MSKKLISYSVVTLLVSGFAISAYLFSRSLKLLEGATNTGFDVCSAAFNTSCDATLLSTDAIFLGAPVAAWGLVYFGGLCALLTFGSLVGARFESSANTGSVVVATAGLIVSAVLLSMFATGTVPLCPVCIVVHTINFLLWPALFMNSDQSLKQTTTSIKNGLVFLVRGEKNTELEDATWKFAGYIAILLVAVAIYQATANRYERAKTISEMKPGGKEVLVNHALERKFEIPSTPDDARKGPEDADIQFVVYSDFQCPSCRTVARRLDTFIEEFKNRVSITYKHFPLDPTCNPTIRGRFHDAACHAAILSEHALTHDKFWDFHDAVFNADKRPTKESVDKIAIDLELPALADSEKDSYEKKIQRHIQEAVSMGVNSTPAVFINGRHVPEPGETILDILVWHELLSAQDRAAAH